MKPTDAFPHPPDWHKGTVGELVEIKRGISWSKSQENSESIEGTVPVIRIGNVQDSLELDDLLHISGLKKQAIEAKAVGPGWSLVVGSNGNRDRVGNAVLVQDQEFVPASFLVAAKPKVASRITPGYFFRWLTSERTQAYLSASSEGTTGLNNLSHGFFKKMTIAFPSNQDEQDRISEILRALDSVIEGHRAVITDSRRLKKAVLQELFYGALGETAYANRPKKRLPSGWTLLSMADLLDGKPKNGVSPETSAQPPGVPTFSIGAVRDGRVTLVDETHIKFAQLPEKVADRYRVAAGDVLMVRGNANPEFVGKAGIVMEGLPEGCIYPDITKRVRFRINGSGVVAPEYAVTAWNHPIVHNQVLRRAKTSQGTLKINNRDIAQIIVPVPPPTEQTDIARLVQEIDSRIVASTKMMQVYRRLSESIQYELLTGNRRLVG